MIKTGWNTSYFQCLKMDHILLLWNLTNQTDRMTISETLLRAVYWFTEEMSMNFGLEALPTSLEKRKICEE